MASKRAGCEHCEPIILSDVADLLGFKETYARKLLTLRSPLIPPPQPNKLGQAYWWWKHDVEAFIANRATPPK